ncbi:MAG: response regulator transcription factor [Bacteroidia bacterium]|nr:response regulator transcription factor [Bacteroidia bacterium]
MLNAIVVDDELKSREVIKTLIGAFCPEVNVVDTAEDIKGALESIRTHNPGLVFLDISLKEGDSFQILQQLDEINFDIIFVTAYDEYSIKALRYSGITCLFKPLDIDELQQAVKDVIKRKTNMNRAYQMVNGILKSKFTKIPVITASGLMFTPVEEITYIEKTDYGTRIYFTDKQSVDSKRNISEFEDIIVSDRFRKVGANHLVNADQVKHNEASRRKLVFHNGQQISIETSDAKSLLDLLR